MSSIEITLGGEKRRLKFNNGAVEVYQKKLFSTPIEMLQSGVVYACIYAGLIGNSFVTGVDFDTTYEDVCDWVDNADKEDLKKACEIFSETTAYQRLDNSIKEKIKEMSVDEKKKKQKSTTRKYVK